MPRPTRFAHERLKTARVDARMSVIRLAAEVGVDPTSIYDWESGASVPSLDYFLRLAVALDCDLHTLLNDYEAPREAPQPTMKRSVQGGTR